jgi:hypothetical protein
MKLDISNVFNPFFANSQYIVGGMNSGTYDMLEKKPPLNSSAMAVL